MTLTPEQLRDRQPAPAAAETIDLRRVSRRQRAEWREEVGPVDHWRPQTRADCANVPRPCPYVGCRHSLYLDVSRYGTIKLNRPDLEPWEMPHSCALDEAELGGMALDDVAARLNVAGERARQIEAAALEKVDRAIVRRRLHVLASGRA